MATSSRKTDTARKIIPPILSVFSVLAQAIGYAIIIQKVLQDPIYVLVGSVLGYLVVLVVCLERLLRKEEAESAKILSSRGEPMRTVRYIYGMKQRVFSVALLLVATTFLVLISTNLLAQSEEREAPDPLLAKEHKERVSVFSLVNISHVNWTGGGAYAVTDDQRNFPFALIIDPGKDDLSFFSGTACALSFDVEVRQRVPWVRVDEIRVVVHSYQALPKYHSRLPAPHEYAKVYYVEIDDPKVARNRIFKASYVFDKGQKKKIGTMRLKKEAQETFVVRINARSPGIYKFSCELLLSSSDSKEKVTIVRKAEFLFDGRSSRDE